MRYMLLMASCLVLISGCKPSVPREGLGTIEAQLPKLVDTKEPYPMPELDRPVELPVETAIPTNETP